MFQFFKSKKKYEPLNYALRKYFENNLLCLMKDFPEPSIDKRRVFLPSKESFPINWNETEENAHDVLKIVSENMQINFDEIEIDFYSEGIIELNSGSMPIFLENNPKDLSSGLFSKKNKEGKYEISINKENFKNPIALIATIAHELTHVKLLGEEKIEENDEYLTDLTTVFFGFGIFTANASFQFFQEYDRWGYSSVGYLKFEEWAYCLSLFAFLRSEYNPQWSNFLNPTIKKEFELCLKYMIENKTEIFNFNGNVSG